MEQVLPSHFDNQIDSPLDSATAQSALPEDSQPHRWSPATRVLFRFAFCYLTLYCLCNGNATLIGVIPKWGDKLQDLFAAIFLYPAQWLAQHLFHVAPPGDKIHPTGSGDTAILWIACLLMLVVSLVAAVVWSALDRRRPHYQTLSAWLRWLIRLTLGFSMVSYGLYKVIPTQMPPPSIISLSEPLGMHSPMSVLWNFIGLNQVYEIVCGSAELIAGLLLLFRRTALLGALVTAFVILNVLLYNLAFDVPVKLFAGHLLLLALFVTLPDVRELFRFFWLHRPAAPTGIWVPPTSRRWFRRTTIGIEIVLTLLLIGTTTKETYGYWKESRNSRSAPCPLRGAWRIDSATLTAPDGSRVPHPVLSSEQRPFVELDIDSATSSAFRDDQGRNWRFAMKTDIPAHTLQFTRPDDSTITFAAASPDATHLVLTPTGAEAKTASTLSLTLVSPPNGYPLLHRGFHWVSEYPYQR